MKEKIRDLYTLIHSRAIRAEGRSYVFLYRRIAGLVCAKGMLEPATGPGVLVKRIAPVAKRILATGYSRGMIAETRRGIYSGNLRFEVADVLSLPYADVSLDAMTIVNVLHLLPEPEFALREAARMSRPDGILAALNFAKKQEHFVDRCREVVPGLVGVRFEHQWAAGEYLAFSKDNGWELLFYKETQARMPFLYAERGRS